ncbi:MAG: hypothetical protein M3436_00505 [Pseudomonadota bacterium]|nr:hypothetical protein [Pseudomonadota bacterium]
MQAPMVLLDEAIRFMLAFEDHQFTRKLTAESSTFALHLTRLRSDLLAVREMVSLGQESAALALARVFFEDIEIAMGLAIDPEFAIAYSNATQDDAFWSKQIGYGKIYPRVRKFMEAGGGDTEHVDGKLSHHKELKSFLSGHIHPTTSSAFRAAFPLALNHPGMFAKRPLGSLGENLRPLCLTLADEVHVFAACCINMFIKPNPPPALAGYEPCGEMDDFLAAAHVLQELVVKYMEPLWQLHREAMAVWEGGLRGDEITPPSSGHTTASCVCSLRHELRRRCVRLM